MTMRVTGALGLLAGLLAVTVGRGALGAGEETLTAPQILSRMGDAYASLKTYQDSGVVSTLIKDVGTEGGGRTVERPFTTAFARPDRFRFESRESKSERAAEPRSIVWWQGGEVKTWSKRRPGVQSPRSPAAAFGGPSGVSVGSAYTVPALLLTDQKIGRRLSDLTAPKRLDDARLGEADCYRVEGRYGNVATTVWLDKATFLVRRVDRRFQSETFSSDETTTYEPVANAEIPPARLEFAPPADKKAP